MRLYHWLGFFTVALASVTSNAATLVSCGPAANYASYDMVDRGFYLPSYPGTSLQQVSLGFNGGDASGSYSITVTAHAGTYDGTVIGTSTATITAPVGASPVAFAFSGNPAVTPNTPVAFVITTTSASTLYYEVATSFSGDATCPLIETNGVTPPLDALRRQGVFATILGDAVTHAVPLGPWLPLLSAFGVAMLAGIRRRR